MADRNLYGRGGRGRDRNWEEERFERGYGAQGRFERGGYGGPSRFEGDEGWESPGGFGSEYGRYGRGGLEQGFNREGMGSREFERGWGSGAGEEWNRGGSETWNRGGISESWSPYSQQWNRGFMRGETGGRGQYAGRGPKGWRRSDERITEEVNEALARHPDLDASEVEVRVQNGEVTITGIVEDRGQKRLAEDIAEDVFGVEDVNNDLKIRHGFLAGLTGEKADEREVHRGAEREPSATTGTRGSSARGKTGRSEIDTR